jgi:hypothetical protein
MAEAERLRLDRETPKAGPARVSLDRQQKVDTTFVASPAIPGQHLTAPLLVERDSSVGCPCRGNIKRDLEPQQQIPQIPSEARGVALKG